ncbi:hypothetical protein LUW75_07010 [Streptomyces sp. MRC013]|uniref:hypothetical protein n=1 Tax=Streptomyces sp. MRC013 TaxID=2898276 RepID=UPI00202767D7|nr:hypothetical protein [Streptomyces sp. MRC013]URM89784.1 hypothetical protein LUW75_07010 [Streptomyces sp. MRC013]
MKKVRLLVWLVATAVLAAGVSVANAAQPPPVPAGAGAAGAKPLETDARTVFKGVFFAQGPVGEMLRTGSVDPAGGDRVAAEELMDLLDDRYPGTVRSVSDAIATRHPQKADAALTVAAHRLRRVTGGGGSSSLTSPRCLALAVAVWYAGAFWTLFWLPAAATPENRLKRERAVAKMITAIR